MDGIVLDSEPILDRLTTAPEQADRQISDNQRLQAVAWLSAHLAAMQHSIHPIIRHRLDDGAVLEAELRTSTHNLMALLRLVERHEGGDLLAAHVDVARLTDDLRSAMNLHVDFERHVAEQLTAVLDPHEQTELVAAYDAALRTAPTRPHLHLTHPGFLTPAIYWFERARDKLLDTMDGRHVPVPRKVRQPVERGRWSHYLGL